MTKTRSRRKAAITPAANALLSPQIMAMVDSAVVGASEAAFGGDPVLPEEVSSFVSFCASIQKRDGGLIEAVISDTIAAAPHFTAWKPDAYPITRRAEELARSGEIDPEDPPQLPQNKSIARHIRIDQFAVDLRTLTATAIEIKRSSYLGKAIREAARHDLLSTAMLARSYARKNGIKAMTGCSVLICFYGDVTPDFQGFTVLTRETVDDYFGVAITPVVEAARAYFSHRVRQRLEELVTPMTGILSDATMLACMEERGLGSPLEEMAPPPPRSGRRPRLAAV
ncbi:hypothetical protein H1W37_19665 [Stappia taiwanensis]|uniref:Restriction endonuclease n=2 Tax=Stappia TaxID=152161 RepID=A0A838XTV7_9HYPH|nr:hypothetical protein [Stappia taiwanensis]MBA4613882.1 hypothetical protein [Stappia taiwanensis]GGF07601.1 hypothetical protein GCM10007285_39390 [Stappia taiwanensis]